MDRACVPVPHAHSLNQALCSAGNQREEAQHGDLSTTQKPQQRRTVRGPISKYIKPLFGLTLCCVALLPAMHLPIFVLQRCCFQVVCLHFSTFLVPQYPHIKSIIAPLPSVPSRIPSRPPHRLSCLSMLGSASTRTLQRLHRRERSCRTCSLRQKGTYQL